MKIRSLEFAGSLAEPGGPRPTDLPQVAFSGRSNVGKSSLINTLLRRTRNKIAHVSSRPGKTQTVNFFRVNERFYLVDLPGYGFARVPAAVREAWKRLVEGYLSAPEGPRGVVHLVDIRQGPTKLDLQMLTYLADLGIPTLVVVTKADKVGRQARSRALADIEEELAIDREQLLPFSARTGEGREALLAALEALLDSSEGS